MPLVDFGILAALPEEFITAQEIFGDFKEYTQNADSWYRMSLKANHGKTYQIVASFQTEMGPLEAQALAIKMMSRWDPAYIILVGIAGTFSKDVQLGDVVVSQQIFNYDPGKAERKRIKYRPQGYPCSLTLIRQHEALLFDKPAFSAWQKAAHQSALNKARKLENERKKKQLSKLTLDRKKKQASTKKTESTDLSALKKHRPKVHFGTVASGNLVIGDKTKQRELLALHGKILATEMEGAGVLNATFRHGEIPTSAVVVKGISDMADQKKATHDEKNYWRQLAAENSTRLALAMIQRGLIRSVQTDQFELDLYRGSISDARERIQGAVSKGMSLLAFPQLCRPLGPLTGFRLDVTPEGTNGPLQIIEMVVEYENRKGQLQKKSVQRSSIVEIIDEIGGRQISVFLLVDGAPIRIEFCGQTWSTKKTTTFS